MAVGKENVLGLIMPNGVQSDLQDAIECCEYCGVKYHIINISDTYNALEDKEIVISATGFDAIVLQHEYDHLNGMFFYDHINESDPLKELDNEVIL